MDYVIYSDIFQVLDKIIDDIPHIEKSPEKEFTIICRKYDDNTVSVVINTKSYQLRCGNGVDFRDAFSMLTQQMIAYLGVKREVND
jgi:hypothetical protein